MVKVFISMLLFLVVSTLPAHAQTRLSVPIGTSLVVWDVDPAAGQPNAATQYVMTCGMKVTVIPAPSTQIPVRDIVPGPGSYDCMIYAENQFGRSASVAVPAFATGDVPPTPANVRIEVR